MGGGDLNMKKSWHPLLLKNQERVWQEENKAREERKRIEQKRKEIAEERQLQELQRLQEAQGGKPRLERLDWMYTAPGAQQGIGENLEQYLLGKKGVQELITGDENEKLKKGDSGGFIAVQNANSLSDTRNKVLNDPLLAIKKQEQRKFEELMKNPILLKQMKMEMEIKNGVKKEDGEDGEKRKHRHHHHKSSHRHRDDEHRSERRHREKDVDVHRQHREKDDDGYRKHRDDDRRSEKRHRERVDDNDDYRSEKRHRERDDDEYRSKSRKYDNDGRPRRSETRDYDDRKRERSPYRPSTSSRRRSPPVKRESPDRDTMSDEAREAALQAMFNNAEDLESSRAQRLAALEVKEQADREREHTERMRNKGLGGRPGFMKDMQNKILEEGRMAAVR
jgi:Pre-mRNA splicing factor/N-terminal domain of CBF1 interacting co-repressor CIR